MGKQRVCLLINEGSDHHVRMGFSRVPKVPISHLEKQNKQRRWINGEEAGMKHQDWHFDGPIRYCKSSFVSSQMDRRDLLKCFFLSLSCSDR